MRIRHGCKSSRLGLAVACLAFLAGCAAAARPARPIDRPAAEDERLVSTPPASRAEAPTAPSLSVVAVSVQPAQIRRGEQVDLVVHYAVGGPASGLPVEERRELTKDGVAIVQMNDTLTRAPGSHTSARPVRVPADAAPGIYTVRITLVAAGAQASGTALFEVR
jgi:hypothetical protein